MALTRGQIIAEGLSQAGRSDLLSNGRLWLNLFLARMYNDQDFHWLEKTSTGLTVSQDYAFPSDYRNAIAASLGTGRAPLHLVEADEWNAINVTTETGAPTHVYPDHTNNVFKFYPAPAAGYTWNLTYYRLPVLPDHSDSGTDSQTPTWKLGDHILIKAVYVACLEYMDDVRFDAEEQKLFGLVAQAKMNSKDFRAGKSRFKMGKSFGKRF